MIEFKFYKELRDFAEKLGLPSDKETMRLYVKLVEKFNADQMVEVQKLKLKNLEGRLQHGHISVSKKDIKEHLQVCKKVVDGIDETMKMPANLIRGSRIAKFMNELNSSLWLFGRLQVNPASSLEGQAEYEEQLIKAFNDIQDELLIKAAFDGTKRRNLMFSISLSDCRGGTVNYNKKESRFDFIQYCINGYAKKIPL